MKINFKVIKKNKRMHIVDAEEKSVYTPPAYVQMLNRSNLQEVADKFNEFGGYNIEYIISFESDIRFRKDYRKNLKYYLRSMNSETNKIGDK